MEKHTVPITEDPEPREARCYSRAWGMDGPTSGESLTCGTTMKRSIHTQANKGGSLEREIPIEEMENEREYE